jgi:cytochrome d ubiquinol oxidase subunit II
VLACAALTMHGAAYILGKTEGPVNARARGIIWRAWVTTIVLMVPATVATFWLRSSMLTRFGDEPWGLVFPLLALGGLALVGHANARGQELAAFAGSSAFLFGVLAATAFSLYPNVLPAVNPAYSLTIHNAAAADFGLRVGLIWWLIGMALAACYFILTYRLFRGKVRMGAAHGQHA